MIPFEGQVRLRAVADRDRESQFEMLSMNTAFSKILDQIEIYLAKSESSQLIQIIPAKDFHLFSGSTLACDVFASVPLPPFNASIKDGYAVIAEDGDGLRQVLNKVSVAGASATPSLTPGYCIRISTGAAVPDGSNAVVQVEDTELVERTAVSLLISFECFN